MFVEEIKQYTMFAVSEIWISKEDKNISIDGYKFYPFCREKKLNKVRGGVGWFVREDLRKWIKIMYEISNENFLWCKLDKHFFGFEEDLYICSVYIPPEYSSREIRLQKDHFKILLETINIIKSENIILVGDFNSRTKVYEDVIESEKHFDDFMPEILASGFKGELQLKVSTIIFSNSHQELKK